MEKLQHKVEVDITNCHIITFGKRTENLIIALDQGVIGSFLGTASQHLKHGDKVFFHCRSLIWGAGVISSDYFFDDTPIWRDKLYPHRFSISDIELTLDAVSLVDGKYNKKFKEDYGPGWAFKFLFTPKNLPDDIATQLKDDLSKKPKCDLEVFKSHLIKTFNKSR